MINTVPRDVTLTEEIILIPFKVSTNFMFIGDQLVFDVKVRVREHMIMRKDIA